MPSRRRATDVVALLGLALGTGVVWWKLVSQLPRRMTLEAADLFLYFLPAYVYEARRLHEHALPLWNPYQETGVPFLATLQPGALYPARLLLVLTDPVTAMAIANVTHLVLLVVATYALCRVLGASPAGAVAGGAVYAAACGRPVLFTPSFLEPCAWLPVAALAVERVIVTGRWRWVMLLGTAAAMPVLAGGYQTSVYVAYALAIFALALLSDPARRGARRLGGIVVQLGLAAVLACALAAPQLLTTLAWASETVRETGQLRDRQIEPWPFLGWVNRLFVRLRQLTVPGAVLAAIGFLASGRFGVVLAAFAAVGAMLSLGPEAPGFALYRWLPAFGMFRGTGRIFTILVAFLCAMAAALGFTALGRRLARGWWRPLLEGGALAVVLALLVPRMQNDAVLPWTSTRPEFATGVPGMFDALRDGEARSGLFGHRGDWAVAPRQGMMHGVGVLTDYEPLVSRHLRDFVRVLRGNLAEDRMNVAFVGDFSVDEPFAHPELLDLLSVRHLVLTEGSPARERTPPLVHAGRFQIYDLWTNPSALPRAYLVHRIRAVSDDASALAALTESGFDGRQEAVVVGDDEETAALRLAAPAPARPARLVEDAPERVTVEFETDRDALLVLTDAFAPGWSVTVDGQPRRLRAANHLVRGVVVRPGERRADFAYRAPGFAAGVATAALGASAVALCAAVGGWRRRRERESA